MDSSGYLVFARKLYSSFYFLITIVCQFHTSFKIPFSNYFLIDFRYYYLPFLLIFFNYFRVLFNLNNLIFENRKVIGDGTHIKKKIA